MCKPKKYFSSVQLNATAWGAYTTSAFSRTWSKRYGLPIVRD